MATEERPPGGGRRRGLSPRRWPVRWRLAAVSASLTFVILVAFAFVVGRLATDRLKSDFRDELQAGADRLASDASIAPTFGGAELSLRSPDLDRMLMGEDSRIRIVDAGGVPLHGSPTLPDLGPPDPRETTRVGAYEVASQQVPTNALGGPVFVQYARSRESLEATVDRLWLFLAGGVIGGTVLAMLAGLAVAGRAMRPIAALTAAARGIATTRDPSRRLPRPEAEDEVAELATTLDEMLRQLDAARTETEQIAQAQREFVADASHELRTPLTSILANLELLQERLESGATGRDGEDAEIVAGALASSRRMRRLVSDLLLLARADAGWATVRRECDLAQVAAAALAEVEPIAAGHRIVAQLDGPAAVAANPDELHRLAVNLIENAIRHTPAGCEVGVRTGAAEGRAFVEVDDDGPGIPDGMEDGIFARFVRGGGPADSVADAGTGLGLAIVRAVAGSHRGHVSVGRSRRGGALFRVELPLGGESTEAERAAAPPGDRLAPR